MSADKLPDIDISQDREAALNGLGSANKSVLNNNGKKKGGTVGIVFLAVAALLFVFMIKNKNEPQPKEETAEITIAQKKTVAPIQFQEEIPPPSPAPIEEPKPAPAPQPAKPDAAELERLRQEAARLEREKQMLEARMKSAVVAPGTQNIDPNAPKALTDGEQGLEANQGAQDRNSRYARSVSSSSVPLTKAKQIDGLEVKILQGKLIEAVLLPRANSDLPGAISCQVSRDVYSSDGSRVLIPWGSKVFGQYNAGVRKGQDRLFVIWNRLVTPSGISISLDSPGADQLGTAGMGGQVNTHFMEMFGASFLISLMGAGAAHLGDSGSEGSAAYYREELSDSMRDTSATILSTYVNIPPTIIVAPGARVRIFVARDLDFSDVIETRSAGQIEPIKVIF